MTNYYVYILKSINFDKYYVGYTTNINRRLNEHNSKSQIYSKNYAPWDLVTYTSFTNKQKATNFETYLKSHSGRAFLNKHLV